MDINEANLCRRLFLLLCLLPMSLTNTTDTTITAVKIGTNTTEYTIHEDKLTNTTVAECLIDNEMGLIAIGSAGGLIVCLLVAVVTLACQVYHLQRRVYIPRSSRSNLDLVGSTEYWANAAAGTDRGLVGPYDANVMLEEVKTERDEEEMQELTDIIEERFEEEGATERGLSPEEKPLMQSSTSRESCSDVPRDLEDMPLVV